MTSTRALRFAGVSAIALTCAVTAADANAQTREELLRELQELKARVRALESAVQNSIVESAQAKAHAQEAALKADAAQKAVDTSESGVEFKFGPSPTIRSKDGLWSFHVMGRLQVDYNYLTASDFGSANDVSTVELRRARIGVEGVIYKDFDYRLEVTFDTGGSGVDVEDARIRYKGVLAPARVTVGQFKTPVSMDEQTSSRFIRFMERAAFTDAFGFERRIGAGVDVGGSNWQFAAGGFFQNANDINNDHEQPSGRDGDIMNFGAVGARGHYTVSIDDEQKIHLGTSFRYRKLDNSTQEGNVRYRQRPYFHATDTRNIDTNFGPSRSMLQQNNVDSDIFLGPEFAYLNGPLAVSSEAGFLWGQRLDTCTTPGCTPGGDYGPLWGAYGDITYWVTGENNTYSAKDGTFGRPKVNNPVFSGGWGAVELGLRFDYLSLDDVSSGVEGGEQFTLIPAVNWWFTDRTKLSANFAYNWINGGDSSPPNGSGGDNDVWGFGLRAQVDW